LVEIEKENEERVSRLMDELEDVKQEVENSLGRAEYISQQIREYLEGKKDE